MNTFLGLALGLSKNIANGLSKDGGEVMTLEKAIIHAEAVAKSKEREAKENRNHGGWAYDDEAKKCSACAAEHRQLAEWLKELKAVHDEIDNADDEDEIFIGYLRKKMRGVE